MKSTNSQNENRDRSERRRLNQVLRFIVSLFQVRSNDLDYETWQRLEYRNQIHAERRTQYSRISFL